MAVVLLAHRRRLGTQNNEGRIANKGGCENEAHPSGK
jgi:hypothetical protein